MKRIFIIIFPLFIFNCFLIKNENPDQKFLNTEFCFDRLTDSIYASLSIDTAFIRIGPSINEFGSDYAFSYSNGKDSIFFLAYTLREDALPFDSNVFKKGIFSKYDMDRDNKIDNINIVHRNEKVYASYRIIERGYSYLNCLVYDYNNKISFEIIYRTLQVTETKTATFQKLCDSFAFEVHMKK